MLYATLPADATLLAGVPVRAGYVKFLSSHALNPETLKFCREDEPDIEIGLDDVRMLGEIDAEFRRSIVSSDETRAYCRQRLTVAAGQFAGQLSVAGFLMLRATACSR